MCVEVASCCIALEDNKAAPLSGLRMAQLTIAKPAIFSSGVIANVLESSVRMNLGDCNINGAGTFSWLLQFNAGSGELVTGGAKPVPDPTSGYCFVNETLDGFTVSPKAVLSNLKAGSFSASVSDMIVPVYLDAGANQYVLLPLHGVKLSGALSPDNNCIGVYNADILDPESDCSAATPEKLAFTNAGSLAAFISLEDADEVVIATVSQTLCAVLTGSSDGGSPAKCSRDANGEITAYGDWCAATNGAATASCADAVRLEAAFAASAVKISGNCP